MNLNNGHMPGLHLGATSNSSKKFLLPVYHQIRGTKEIVFYKLVLLIAVTPCRLIEKELIQLFFD